MAGQFGARVAEKGRGVGVGFPLGWNGIMTLTDGARSFIWLQLDRRGGQARLRWLLWDPDGCVDTRVEETYRPSHRRRVEAGHEGVEGEVDPRHTRT